MNGQATSGTVGVLDEFQTELIAAWQRLPNKGFFLVLLAAWLVLFQFLGNSLLGVIHSPSLMAWMWESYTSPNEIAENDRHGVFIPFLVVGLLWWKRRDLLNGKLEVWLPALAMLLSAIALHLLGYLLQEPHFSVVAFFAGIYGLMGLAWGWGWLKKSFFPFFLCAFAVPLGNHSDIVTTRLQLLVCWLVEHFSNLVLGIEVTRNGTQLSNPSGGYQYDVVAACSGIRSLVAIFLLGTVYGFLTFRSSWKRVFFMALAFPFAVLGNFIRLMCIVIAAQIGGQEAGQWVHNNTYCSLIPYVPAIFGLLWIGNLMEKWYGMDRPFEPGPRPSGNAAAGAPQEMPS